MCLAISQMHSLFMRSESSPMTGCKTPRRLCQLRPAAEVHRLQPCAQPVCEATKQPHMCSEWKQTCCRWAEASALSSALCTACSRSWQRSCACWADLACALACWKASLAAPCCSCALPCALAASSLCCCMPMSLVRQNRQTGLPPTCLPHFKPECTATVAVIAEQM